jgi:hypothetical protein
LRAERAEVTGEGAHGLSDDLEVVHDPRAHLGVGIEDRAALRGGSLDGPDRLECVCKTVAQTPHSGIASARMRPR